jgi:Sec-independent protein translocase protein TatA
LAGRLEQAGRQLDGAIYDAQRRVEQREVELQLANRDKEIAERLKEKAARALAEQMEARLQSLPRHKRSALLGDV